MIWAYHALRPQARKLCPEIRAIADAIGRGDDRVKVRLRPATSPDTFRGLVSTFARRHGLHRLRCRRIAHGSAAYEVCLDPGAEVRKIAQKPRPRRPRPGRQIPELRRVTAAIERGRASVWVELPGDVTRSAFGDALRRYCQRHGLAPLRIWRAEAERGRVYVVELR